MKADLHSPGSISCPSWDSMLSFLPPGFAFS
ncbi:hypothetical protein ID866_7627 [Astraeus odoratus]|nr:hypothetical protein ID866_7627 [Astraeus odoratus]